MTVTTTGKFRKAKAACQRSLENPWPQGFIASIARRSCDAPSLISEGLWRLEGEEIKEEDLLAYLKSLKDKSLNRILLTAKRKAVKAFREEGLQKVREQLHEEVTQACGLSQYEAVEEFKAWLANIKEGQEIYNRREVLVALRTIDLAMRDLTGAKKALEKLG